MSLADTHGIKRVSEAAETKTVELYPGLFVQFRRPNSLDMGRIDARAAVAAREAVEGGATLAELTTGDADSSVLESAETFQAVSRVIVAIEGAIALIVDWTVAFDDSDEVAPLERASFVRLFSRDPTLVNRWIMTFQTYAGLDYAEGNDFASAPNTSSSSESDAGDALNTATLAPVEASNPTQESSAL